MKDKYNDSRGIGNGNQAVNVSSKEILITVNNDKQLIIIKNHKESFFVFFSFFILRRKKNPRQIVLHKNAQKIIQSNNFLCFSFLEIFTSAMAAKA